MPVEPGVLSNGCARRVVIVQPYVPDYRRALFEGLHERLREHDVDLEILAGTPMGQNRARGDATDLPFVTRVRVMHVTIRGRTLRWRSIQRHLKRADLVVSELASGALDNYLLALRPSVRLAVWGHGFATLGKPNRLDEVLERWLMRRSVRFFAYTQRGARAAAAAGIDADKVTVLNNTIDTAALESARAELTVEEHLRFVEEHRLGSGPVCVFIGALDASKRLDMLLEAGSRLAERCEGFRLVMCGTGDDQDRVIAALDRFEWLRYIGRVDAAGKARLASCASLILNPGVVGLLAIDSFALGLPIVTTSWPYHGPEIEYLEDGVTAVITPDSTSAFVEAVESLLNDPERLSAMSAACVAALPDHGLAAMIDRFAEGILTAWPAMVQPTLDGR